MASNLANLNTNSVSKVTFCSKDHTERGPEFKRVLETKVYFSQDTNEWRSFQNHLKICKQKAKKWMSKTDAAIIIQRAYRSYRRRKLLMMLNKDIVRKIRPCAPPSRGRRNKVVEMFTPSKNDIAKLQMNQLSNSVLSPIRKNLLTEKSLFQKDKESVIVMGGIDPHNDYGVGKNTGQNIFRYVPDENQWEFVGELPEPRHHHCAQFFKGRIYIVGGADPRQDEMRGTSLIIGNAWSFDPVRRSWYSEPCLLEARKNFGLVTSNHSLYAVGGQGKEYEPLKSLEVFNLEKKVWESKSPMIHGRIGLGCVKYRNHIWVAGGLTGSNKQRTLLDSVESYSLKHDQWTEIQHPLRFPRCFSCMFVLSDCLYVIGGAGKSSEQYKSTSSIGNIEIWDSKKFEWKNITKMHIPRHGHSVAYLGTQILVIGGVTTTYRRALSHTECFCSQRGTWVRGLACLPIGLSGHTSVTLPPASLLTY